MASRTALEILSLVFLFMRVVVMEASAARMDAAASSASVAWIHHDDVLRTGNHPGNVFPGQRSKFLYTARRFMKQVKTKTASPNLSPRLNETGPCNGSVGDNVTHSHNETYARNETYPLLNETLHVHNATVREPCNETDARNSSSSGGNGTTSGSSSNSTAGKDKSKGGKSNVRSIKENKSKADSGSSAKANGTKPQNGTVSQDGKSSTNSTSSGTGQGYGKKGSSMKEAEVKLASGSGAKVNGTKPQNETVSSGNTNNSTSFGTDQGAGHGKKGRSMKETKAKPDSGTASAKANGTKLQNGTVIDCGKTTNGTGSGSGKGAGAGNGKKGRSVKENKVKPGPVPVANNGTKPRNGTSTDGTSKDNNGTRNSTKSSPPRGRKSLENNHFFRLF